MYTIIFEDDGQDFLEWDVDSNGEVIECRPFQEDVWFGTYIHDVDIQPGDYLDVTLPSGQRATLEYAVYKVLEIA